MPGILMWCVATQPHVASKRDELAQVFRELRFVKPLDSLRKIGFVLQPAQLWIVFKFYSTRELENRSLSLRSSAALVSVELAQLWQHPSDGFSQSLRLL